MTNKFKLFKGNGVFAGYADTIQEAMSTCDKQKGWYFEKDGKLTKEELNHKVIRLCINKELEPYGVTYDEVKQGGDKEFLPDKRVKKNTYLWGLFKKWEIIDVNKPWNQHYTFNSEQELNDWKEFCINLFRKELKMTKTNAETAFVLFNSRYGLKQIKY